MKPIATMNVIPFIDVMLVLLAIVLTTATFVAQGRIPVDLPKAASAVPLESGDPLEITITAEGGLFVDGREQPFDALPGLLGVLDPRVPLVIRVDQAAAFSHFVKVIDPVKAAGLRNVSIVTRQPGP